MAKNLIAVRVVLELKRRMMQEAAKQQTPEQTFAAEEIRKCRADFRYFLRYWKFTNRETGEVMDFSEPWPGQSEFADLMMEHKWIIALKAGKLGFTQIETAYDAWVALFGPPNARVHVFSRVHPAAQELLGYIEFGLSQLPEYMKPTFLEEEAGGKTSTSLMWRYGEYDTRRIVAYAAGKSVSIDQSCIHAHVDELARMSFPLKLWNAVYSTVSPSLGSCHIVSRGNGPNNYMAELWRAAKSGRSKLHAFFTSWRGRPDRDEAWYAQQSEDMTTQELLHFAPEREEDALAGDMSESFVPIQQWDACIDPEVLPLSPEADKRTPLVVGVDAAVSGDTFAIVVVSRNTKAHATDVDIRDVGIWYPQQGGDGAIDYSEPKAYLENLIKTYNVTCVVYDPYQLHYMMQEFNKRGIVWVDPFDQGARRLKADGQYRTMIMHRNVHHRGDKVMRKHMENAGVKTYAEDKAIRMVKLEQGSPIDLGVAGSMAIEQCLRLAL